MPRVVLPDTTSDQLRLTVDVPTHGMVVVEVRGELDMATAPRFESTVCDCLRRHGPSLLTLDLTGVRFFSCAGVSALLRVDDVAAGIPATVRLVAGDPVLRPLRLLGLDDLRTFVSDRSPPPTHGGPPRAGR